MNTGLELDRTEVAISSTEAPMNNEDLNQN